MVNCMNNKGNVLGNDHCEGCITFVELSSLIVLLYLIIILFCIWFIYLEQRIYIACVDGYQYPLQDGAGIEQARGYNLSF